jgi:hypothetical protein
MAVYAEYDEHNLLEKVPGTGNELKVSLENVTRLKEILADLISHRSLYDGFANAAEAAKYLDAYDYFQGPADLAVYSGARTVSKDYLWLIGAVLNVVTTFDDNPAAYWPRTQLDTPVGSGDYTTRPANGLTDPDLARKDGEDYTVTEAKLNQITSKLDHYLANGDITKPLSALDLGLDLSSFGVDLAQPQNIQTLLNGILNSKLYSNDLINTLIQFLYPMVLPQFENAFGGLANPSTLGANTGLTLTLYTLHDILANTGSASLTDNTIQDLRIYPDLLANSIDSKFAAAKTALANTFFAGLSTTTSIKTSGVTGFQYGSSYRAQYGYTEGAWSAWNSPAIFAPTLDANGKVVYDENGVPTGKLTLDWGLDNPALSATERRALFLEAAASALSGIFPLLRTIFAGVDYYGFHDRIGELHGSAAVGSYTAPLDLGPNGSNQGGIYLELNIPATNAYQSLLTPIFEVLAGEDPALNNTIPAKTVLQNSTAYSKSTAKVTKNYAGSGDGSGTYQANLGGLFGIMDAVRVNQNNSGFFKTSSGRSAYAYNAGNILAGSKNLVNSIFNPILGFVDKLGAAPVSSLLELLPNLGYAFNFGKIDELLTQDLNLKITVDADGWIRLGILHISLYGGVIQIDPDLPDGSLKTGLNFDVDTISLADALSPTHEKVREAKMTDEIIIPPMNLGEIIQGAIPPGMFSDLSGLIGFISPDLAAKLPTIDVTRLGTYGEIKLLNTPALAKDPDGKRHYVAADKADVLYALLRWIANPAALEALGVSGLGNFDTAQAIAALTELFVPYNQPAGYAENTIGYTVGDVNPAHKFKEFTDEFGSIFT